MTAWRAYLDWCEAHPLPPAANSVLLTLFVAGWFVGVIVAALWSL